MSTNINKEKAERALTKISQTYENSPFFELISAEIKRPNLLKFVEKRVEESGEWKMSMVVTDYFLNFNLYPDKIKNVLVVETHEDFERLKENGYFKNPNNTLRLILNNTTSKNIENGKVKKHYDYWRLFVSEALDYLQIKYPEKFKYYFAGTETVHDFSEIISQENHKILLPDTESVCYSDGSLDKLEFALDIK